MRKRFTEEQIVKILQEHAEGKTVGEVCRNIWNIRKHVLHMETQIRRHAGKRCHKLMLF